MKRLDFLKSFISSGALLTTPFIVKAVEKKIVPVLLYSSYVAGFQFGEGMKVMNQMKVNDELHLVREPENKHDETAVAVYWKQHRIGYISRFYNEMPNILLQKGLALQARIDELNIEDNAWKVCKAGIYLLYPKDLIQNNISIKELR